MKCLDEIFKIEYGNGLELLNCEEDLNGINFISRISSNNGVIAKVRIKEDVEPMPPYAITVALGGSVLSSFFQNKPFYTSFHIYCLYPKKMLSEQEMIFYCAAIEKNKYRYNYGRQANKSLKDIRVPSVEEIPKTIKNFKMDSYFNPAQIINDELSLDTSNWKYFNLDDIFEIYASKDNNLLESEAGRTPYISSTQYMNGVSDFISASPSHNCNTITIARNGSVGAAFFHFYNYCASPDDVRILKPKFEMNQYIGIFLTVLLEKEKYRYAYGRKFGTKRLKETRLKLPTNAAGNPDWQLMENYIKSLPYSSSLS